MKRLTALSLLLVMLCSAFMVGTAAPAAEPEITDPKQLGEVLELREKNSETYRLEDGSYECVVFAEDKYFEDETGKLVEISNTVVPEKHTIAGKEYGFTNEANSNRIYFSENEPSVLVSTGKQDLAFNIVTDRAVTPVIGGLKDVGEIAEYSLSGDTCFAYMNAFEHTDLVYKVRNSMLKEYIVLNDASAPREFTFTFDTEGYTVSYTEYDTVGFYDGDGELVFELGDLFAVDSADALTDELAYTIGETVDGKTDITVTLSDDYAADPERAYPILVDPSVMVTGTYETQDSFVSSLHPTTNYYSKIYIRMGWDSNYNIRRTYIRFNLPTSIISGIITSAYMSLKKHDCGYDPELRAYRVTGSWASNAITWNNKPGYTSTNASATAEERTNNWYRFYVTDIVRKWYAGTYQNYGFMVKNSAENGTGNWSTFYSSDADSPNKPELRIVYNPDGVTYYMAFQEDGKLITSNSSYSLSKASFVNGNDYQKWVFTPASNGIFTIRMKSNMNKCLTAVPGTLRVIVGNVSTDDTNQLWSIASDNTGIYSRSSDTSLYGKRIYYTGNMFKLSNDPGDSLATFGADSFVPCTAIHISTMSINCGNDTVVSLSYLPSNASATSNAWTTYSSSDNNIFTVNANGILHAENVGTATLTVKNKITNISGTAEIRVSYPPHPNAQNKDNWCWAASSKMVGEHNSSNVYLEAGIKLLTNEMGIHYIGGTLYYGIRYDYRLTADAGQRYIVKTVCGSDEDIGAEEASYISQALSLATGNTLATSMMGNGVLSSTDIAYMQGELLSGNWVVGIIYQSFSDYSHAIVFKNMIENPNVYAIWDPWNNSNHEITLDEDNCFYYNNSFYRVTFVFVCH